MVVTITTSLEVANKVVVVVVETPNKLKSIPLMMETTLTRRAEVLGISKIVSRSKRARRDLNKYSCYCVGHSGVGTSSGGYGANQGGDSFSRQVSVLSLFPPSTFQPGIKPPHHITFIRIKWEPITKDKVVKRVVMVAKVKIINKVGPVLLHLLIGVKTMMVLLGECSVHVAFLDSISTNCWLTIVICHGC